MCSSVINESRKQLQEDFEGKSKAFSDSARAFIGDVFRFAQVLKGLLKAKPEFLELKLWSTKPENTKYSNFFLAYFKLARASSMVEIQNLEVFYYQEKQIFQCVTEIRSSLSQHFKFIAKFSTEINKLLSDEAFYREFRTSIPKCLALLEAIYMNVFDMLMLADARVELYKKLFNDPSFEIRNEQLGHEDLGGLAPFMQLEGFNVLDCAAENSTKIS